MLTVGSLFAGIGGFDLGFERAGMRTLWQVEQSEFCRRVLERHFPDAQRFEDVRDVGAAELAPVDVICGGFPCQDLSYAGKGAGLEGERSGLWSEYARIVRELRPRYVVVENVSALLARGLGRVLGDLAEIGYDAEWDCIPASAVGAPHRRDRLWLVAYPANAGLDGSAWRDPQPLGRGERSSRSDADGLREAVAYPHRGRLEERGERDGWPDQPGLEASRRDDAGGRGSDVGNATRCGRDAPPATESGEHQEREPARSPRGSGGDGADMVDPEGVGRRQGSRELGGLGTAGRGWWSVEPDVGRVAHGVPARVDRLRALGNALVPDIAEWIGRRILEWEGLS